MGRLGIHWEHAVELITYVSNAPELELEGIFSHFANANDPSDELTSQQISRFFHIKKNINSIDIPLFHIGNSDGINNFPIVYSDECNMVRTGINLYGVFDLLGHHAYELKPAISLYSSVAAIRTLPKGMSIGYGSTYTLKKESIIATVPIGYADGLPLALSNTGTVLIRGQKCPIIGRVSMDYITVDISELNNTIQAGERVTLIGADDNENITVEDWARIKKTHPYDILCAMSERISRVYL